MDFHEHAIACDKSGVLLGYSPKWNPSKHEAKVDYRKHKTSIEMMSPFSIIAHEQMTKMNRSRSTYKLTYNVNNMSNVRSSNIR